MEIGNKIQELRKQQNLSQEQLAEKVGVARQTISKWELGETAPDISQAKELSKALKVSIDELVANDISHILVEKISNTERLAGIGIKVIKFISIVFVALLTVDIISFIVLMAFNN